MSLNGERAVIFGGTSGIGLATARLLGETGVTVVIAGRDRARLDRALGELGGTISGAILDATDAEAVARFFRDTGSFDHLILTLSGGGGGGPFSALDLGTLRRGFDGKFWAQIGAAQAALPTIAPAGSLTFVTSISARTASPGTAGLAAINGALEAMIGPLALELAPRRVNAVSPGVVATDWWNRADNASRRDATFAETAANTPVGRVGQPEDIARAIVLLVGNSFMTGTIVECDGGRRLV